MYCANCGQESTGTALRCSGCRHFSMTFWLTLFNVVAWSAIVATNYAIFICLVPVLADMFAGSGSDISQTSLLSQFPWSNVLWSYGVLILPFLAISAFGLAISCGRSPKLGRAMAVLSCLGLVFMAMIVVADCRYLRSIWPSVTESMEQMSAQRAESRALDSTRRVIIAEFRYRELHAKIGFTCDLEPLVSLGGPEISDRHDRKANEWYTMTTDFYTVSLRACKGQPVTEYEVSTAPNPGIVYTKLIAYCSDGSGALYSAADGKSQTCLTARTPLH
jgi:hypothetical protein